MDKYENNIKFSNEYNMCMEECKSCDGFRINYCVNESRLVEYNKTDKKIEKRKPSDILI